MTFERCVTNHAKDFHKCCRASAIKTRETSKWRFHRTRGESLIGASDRANSLQEPIRKQEAQDHDSQRNSTQDGIKLQAFYWWRRRNVSDQSENEERIRELNGSNLYAPAQSSSEQKPEKVTSRGMSRGNLFQRQKDTHDFDHAQKHRRGSRRNRKKTRSSSRRSKTHRPAKNRIRN